MLNTRVGRSYSYSFLLPSSSSDTIMNDETIRAGFSKCFAHFHHHYFVRFNAVTKRPNGCL